MPEHLMFNTARWGTSKLRVGYLQLASRALVQLFSGISEVRLPVHIRSFFLLPKRPDSLSALPQVGWRELLFFGVNRPMREADHSL